MNTFTDVQRAEVHCAPIAMIEDAIILLDAGGVIADWSKSAESFYGWRAEEAIGQPLVALLGPGAATLDEVERGNDKRRTRDGRCVDVNWQRRKMASGTGLTAEVSVAVSEANASNELTRYRTLYRSAGAAIWEHDWSGLWYGVEELRAQGISDFRKFFNAYPDVLAGLASRVKILGANDEAVRLFEAESLQHLIDGPLPRIFTDDTRASFTRSLCSLIEKRPRIESECGFRTLRGNPLRIMLRVTPLDVHRWTRIVVTMIDITERTRAQQALSQALDELAHISRVTTLGELTASIAHELNQPLVAIVTEGQGALRWLRRDPPDLDEAQEGISRAVSAAVRAGEIMQRLRAMARRSGRQLARLSLGEVIEEAAQLVQRELQRRQVTFRIDKVPTASEVIGDRIQLQQVVINLLINAAQAMEAVEEGPRRLVVSLTEPGPGLAGFEVSDTGPGIADEAAEVLFRPFFSTKPNGLGMGLSICRSIIEAHSGRIWVKNLPGGGALAGIALPTADAVEAAREVE